MKKLFLIAALAVATLGSAFAQGPFKAGANLTYGTDNLNLGLGINGAYSITEQIEIAAAFSHFFGTSESIPGTSVPGVGTVGGYDLSSSYNVLDVDARYYFAEAGAFNIYGAAGFAMNMFTSKAGDNKTTGNTSGLNLGIGAKYELNDALSLVPEVKYTLNDGSFMRIGVSVLYNF
ncbi:MAG: outer membrane beta-barrel protein [Mangrovibacterium sp.]